MYVCLFVFVLEVDTQINMTATKYSDTSSFQQPLLSEPHSAQPQPPPQYVIVLPHYPPPHSHRLFRKSCQRCLFCFATVFLFLVAAAYILWPSNPHLSVVRLRLDRIHFHTRPKISVDITLDLSVKVQNRDFYSMNYDSLLVAIGYRGKRLGYVTSAGGRIKARGFSYVNATLQLDRVEILSDVILLIEDLAKGAVTFDTETEIGGKLEVIFFDLPLKVNLAFILLLYVVVLLRPILDARIFFFFFSGLVEMWVVYFVLQQPRTST